MVGMVHFLSSSSSLIRSIRYHHVDYSAAITRHLCVSMPPATVPASVFSYLLFSFMCTMILVCAVLTKARQRVCTRVGRTEKVAHPAAARSRTLRR